MCGIAGILGKNVARERVASMLQVLEHRGPDAEGVWQSSDASCMLGHRRLAIIDLSSDGIQPFVDPSGQYVLVFNGEIYNYRELKAELVNDYAFRTETDTEVLLAAYCRWGSDCLDRLNGMFAFAIWDTEKRRLFAARDRFGVKPFYFAQNGRQEFVFASEIKGLFAASIAPEPDPVAWSSFLMFGTYANCPDTFWRNIQSLPAGSQLVWQDGRITTHKWYDLKERVGEDFDRRDEVTVASEYRHLLEDSIRLRFRADVPVGINLSGGVDSSVLLGAVHAAQGADSDVKAFTFTCGDAAYDELPWVQCLLEQTAHESVACELHSEDVPSLAAEIQLAQDEPYGGLPTIAYAWLFERARELGTIVLLDGQGMDEQWAGYDYYRSDDATAPLVQGTTKPFVRPECLTPDFRALAVRQQFAAPFSDRLRNLQYRDLFHTKLPRALRFNDRVSMRASTELREPFLDYRLVELAFRQPRERKIHGDNGKWMLRQIATQSLPTRIVEAPKRAMQTPQREWLRGPLREWVQDRVEAALENVGGSWLDANAVRRELADFFAGQGDNSFFIWQWLSVSWLSEKAQVCLR